MQPCRRPTRIALLASLLLLACGDQDAAEHQNQNACPTGLLADGPACKPIFDDPSSCAAPNEMPVLGGGCRAVGVIQCAAGFLSDGEGGCAPILPAEPCLPGTMERIGHTNCQPVGVTQCAEGFLPDGEGGCDAILPAAECPSGTIEVIGFGTCQPLGDCGPEDRPWGLIEVDETTVYVDASADATVADGSVSAPFPSISAALDAVEPGGHVAIAAGEYEEVVTLTKRVRLEGRCSALVTLRGRPQLGQPSPALSITSGGTGSEVHGVTLTGPGIGLRVTGAQQVVVEAVEVRGTGSFGVQLESDAEAALRRMTVVGSVSIGLYATGSALRAEQIVVQGTLSHPGTGGFGEGIEASCISPQNCGSLHLDGSLVTGNRFAGIRTFGVAAEVSSSVVRGTLPQESDQQHGGGIYAYCKSDLGICGQLVVAGSLVTGNREAGISASGVATTIRSSTIRETLPQQSDMTFGRGIDTQCDHDLFKCGELLVENSLVTGSSEVGIGVKGVSAQVNASVLSGSPLPGGESIFGPGIIATCDMGTCGGLRVEDSLVSGNREAGLSAWGVDLTVQSSVIRDTLPRAFDLANGQGIVAGCDEGVCAGLWVESCLVTGNRDAGIVTVGTEVTVLSSVVRDTLPQSSDRTSGRGIVAACLAEACGVMWVEASLISGNRDLGILASGVEATVRSSVVRDTLPRESDQAFGRGIAAQCEPEACGSLVVDESLVAKNHEAGVSVSGVEATVRSSMVCDTIPRVSDNSSGLGINSQCDPDAKVCGRLTVEGSLVSANRLTGIRADGAEVVVRSSTVRDSQPGGSNRVGGWGVVALCDPSAGSCGTLFMEDSLVTRCEDVGVLILGVPADLRAVAVIDITTNVSGPVAGEGGQAIWAQCYPDTDRCGSLCMTSSLVGQSHGAGVAVEGVSGFFTRSVVNGVLGQPLDDLFGYGIQIGGKEGAALPTFHVLDSVIRDAKLAGVLFFRAQGTLSGTTVSGGDYCVAMNEGSSATVTDNNRLDCEEMSDPQWVNLYPSPAPPPLEPRLESGE